jgi:protein-L-isoaspartate(D-aspartate) O-methyltransferase
MPLEARGIRDARVLDAMRTVPRHRFVPDALRASAHDDRPLPIGNRQTISQPFIVAYMAEALRLQPGDRVLEVGSGSGYAAAVLSLLVGEVYGIELEAELHQRSVNTLEQLGYRGIQLRHGDGFLGWPEKAPFDAILMSCAAEDIPKPLGRALPLPGGLRPWEPVARAGDQDPGRTRGEDAEPGPVRADAAGAVGRAPGYQPRSV